MLVNLTDAGGKSRRTSLAALGTSGIPLVLSAMLCLGLIADNSDAQVLSDIQLETPILPAGMPMQNGMPPAVHGSTTGSGRVMQAAPVHSEVVQPGQYPAGQYASGPIISQPYIGSGVQGEVAQASFVGCASCGSVGCDGCGSNVPGYACPPNSTGLWLRADYLSWYEKGNDLMPLVTTSSGFTADPDDLLTLGVTETSVAFGGEVKDNPLEGWRMELGTWLNAAATHGIYGRYFNVGDRGVTFSAGPNDFNFLGIPFVNTDAGAEDANALTVPNERRGSVNVNLTGDVSGFELLYRQLAQTGCNYRIDWVCGYRNFQLDERLVLSTNSVFTVADDEFIPENTSVTSTDDFRFQNDFHGVDFGITGHSHEGKWSMDFLMKVALGLVDQQIEIDGFQFNTIPGVDPSRNIGGLFSQESNIGKHDESEFAWVPELNLNLGYALTANLDFTVGYTFIYISDVARAGRSIDRSVDAGLVGDLEPFNSNRPQPLFDQSSYWIHGLNLGLTGRF